ncbi:MAG: DNA polymerase II large subunit [Nanoarchaeota archaeon]
MNASPELKRHFAQINEELSKSYSLAAEARGKGLDPEKAVPIPLARNMAERVVSLVSVLAPQITKTNVTTRIAELEKEFGQLDWRVGFRIAEEVAQEKHCRFRDKLEAMEVGIRVGFAYLTLGIVSAPLEGFIGLKIKKRRDGKEYFALQYAGPIRGAGGTAASTSVILADYVRVKMGYAPYDPDEAEVNRYNIEIHDYHERVTNLQYHPSDEELKFMVAHLPVEVDGDPTEDFEVSNYKDLPRIETNFIRGGAALVLAEGLCQKSPKIWKRLSKWGKEFGLEWSFLEEFLKLKEKIHSAKSDENKNGRDAGTLVPSSQAQQTSQTQQTNQAQQTPVQLISVQPIKQVKPNNTFIMDLVAGRPILTYPLGVGGFRLRYGRTRTSGFSASALHPATLIVLDKYIAIGTQLKVERPGKGATVTICDTLEGPIVRLNDKSVVHLKTEEIAKQYSNSIEEIIFLGDILFNYGDFSENGQDLVPAGYCPEWWALEVEKAISSTFAETAEPNEKDIEGSLLKASSLLGITRDRLSDLISSPLHVFPEWEEAKAISRQLNIPLHPDFIFYWKTISGEDVISLGRWLQTGSVRMSEMSRTVNDEQEGSKQGNNKQEGSGLTIEKNEENRESSGEDERYIRKRDIKKIILPYFNNNKFYAQAKRILELLGVPHKVVGKENVVIEKKEAQCLAYCYGFTDQISLNNINWNDNTNWNDLQAAGKGGLEVINYFSNSVNKIVIRDKAGTFIGARMGRPEKAKMRHLTGSPQVMFPVGEEGDRLRSFQAALQAGKVRSTFPFFYCPNCQKEMIYPSCEECGSSCVQRFNCRLCGDLQKEACRHGKAVPYKTFDLDIGYYFEKAKERLGEKLHPDLIKGVRGTSNKNHITEHLAKGILRAKHNIYVNKDGTTRYDCTELPITHFKPKEIGASVEQLTSIGYEKDIYGQKLADSEQILEIMPQDIILPGFDSLDESAPGVLLKVANFVDDLLVKFYGLKPFYNLKKKEDLVGHLVIALAPHISAGLVGRIIGFSQTQSLLAHPMFHAGLRRDCDGDEAAVMLLLDALLNFSRQYLPNTRGSTMDSPLVLTATLDPAEVDDQVHGIDVVWKYPLEFYEASLSMKKPWEVKHNSKKIEQLSDRLGTEKQYQDFGFTHHVSNFNKGVQCSAYKTLPSMEEKLIGQMEIAKKVRAVDMDDVAKLVIQKHFLKDIKGNLRKFSMQQFRCGKCNAKYRRPPLTNKCRQCGGKLIFTVTHGSVVKYLSPSLMLAEKYDFSPYLKQSLEVIKANVEQVFGKEREKQEGLAAFM